MMIKEILKKKKIKFKDISPWGVYLRFKWEEQFAEELTNDEKEDINMFSSRFACGFLWHIFSYDQVEHLKGNRAVDAFNKVNKEEIYIFHQNDDDAVLVEKGSLIKFSDIEKNKFDDIYIVDKNFNWTFVKTHENYELGPYYMYR